MFSEIWKDIPGYEGLYQVSNKGNVRSLNYRRTGKTKILKPSKCGKSRKYQRVVLCGKSLFVHRLVWEAFNGPIPEGMVINHKDENPENNNLDNIIACSQSENLSWGTAQDRRVKNHTGKNKTRWVIKLNEKNEILHFYQSVHQASRETKIPYSSIQACCCGKQKTAGLRNCEKYIWKYAI